jgi:radical SAM superfamily enzyme YgiQ (UPF0313 family)
LSLARELRERGHTICYVGSPFSETEESHTGRVLEALQARPDVVMITAHTVSGSYAERLMGQIKEVNPETFVVLGGAHARVLYTLNAPRWRSEAVYDGLRNTSADLVVTGPGEGVVSFLSERTSDARDLAKRNQFVHASAIIRKFPEYAELSKTLRFDSPLNELVLGELRFARVYARIGCGFNCAFCAEDPSKVKIRLGNLENVMGTVRKRYEKGARYVYFGDEDFFAPEKFSLELLSQLKRFNTELKVSGKEPLCFGCQARLESVKNDIERGSKVLKGMQGVGTWRSIDLGFETDSQEALDLCNKEERAEILEDCVDKIREHGIYAQVNLLAGLPGETVESYRKTTEKIASLTERGLLFAEPSMVQVYPGVPIHERGTHYGFKLNGPLPSWELWNAALPGFHEFAGNQSVPAMSAEVMYKIGYIERLAVLTGSIRKVMKNYGVDERILATSDSATLGLL